MKFLFSIFLLMGQQVFAEIVSIPLAYTSYPAKDLVDENGKSLSTDQLAKIWKEKSDLSFLKPEESDIWKNQIKKDLNKETDDFNVKENENFEYIDKVVSTIGVFRFLVQESESKQKRNFNIWLSKDSRSILLRKNLLRMMGYIVPKIQHKKTLKIQFKGKASLSSFIKELENNTYADSKRWITSIDEEKNILELQDVLLLEGNTRVYNLALGEILDDTIKHRRSLNVLSLMFALVDVRESVDGLPWSVGKIDNKVALFDINHGDYYTTTYYDAIWILKRLSVLEKKDIEKIVELSYFPHSVQMLLVEKLSSRLNSLLKLFNIKQSHSLAVNYAISDESGELASGRLTKDTWEGHASRYSYDDTESPLSKSEMMAYFKSKFLSAAIENVVTYVNEKFLYSTDIQKEAIKHAIGAQKKQFQNLLQTGELKDIPFSTWTIPTVKGNVRASRDIITGSYLGTDNSIQIADSLEFVGDVGVFVGTLGLPVESLLYLNGNANYSRSYTHVKSIKSIKKALKEPFRNIIVPMVKKKKAGSILGMIKEIESEDFKKLKEEERTSAVEKIFQDFNSVLSVGDSLIISNNLVFNSGLVAGYKIPYRSSDIESSIQFNARKMMLWRFHIVRSGEKEFQFYRSKVASLGEGLNFNIKAKIPILMLSYDHQKGHLDTKFYSLKFSNQDDDESLISKLHQLRQVIMENSAELLSKNNPPFIIQHNFNENAISERFIQDQALQSELNNKMNITHPQGYSVNIFIKSKSILMGENYMQVAYDLLNSLIEKYLEDENISVSNTESGNPGDSLYGRSFAKQILVEVPDLSEESEILFEDYAEIKSKWKGWKASRDDLNEIKDIVARKYGKQIFPDELFYDTEEIELYSVDVNFSIYEKGLRKLVLFPSSEFSKVIDKYFEIPWSGSKYKIMPNGSRIPLYMRKKKKALKAIKLVHQRLKKDYTKLADPNLVSKDLRTLIGVLEAFLPFEEFSKMLGGDDNYYIKGRVSGFRGGVENGEDPLISNAIGEFGSEYTRGTVDTLKNAINISEGELGAYWFLRKLL